MLNIRNLTKKFKKFTALDEFSFEFQSGVYGLLGPNGAGKTTLLRCISKLYPVQDGTIFYEGRDINKDKAYLQNIGYLPQAFGMFKDLSVKDMMLLMASLKDIPKGESEGEVERVVTIVNLEEKLNEKVSSLSGGMVRRLGIAQALLGSPKIIIFDEPTTGLDPEERLRFKNIISKMERDSLVIISTHIVEDVEASCDKIAIINGGKLVTSGDNTEIKNIAEGKVYMVPQEVVPSLPAGAKTERFTERDGTKFARVLCNEKLNFETAMPDIEDGYICAVKNI